MGDLDKFAFFRKALPFHSLHQMSQKTLKSPFIVIKPYKLTFYRPSFKPLFDFTFSKSLDFISQSWLPCDERFCAV
jgi:hypothetical protein